MASCRAIVDFSQHSSSFLNVIFEEKFLDRRFGCRKKGVIKEDMQFISIHLLVKVFSAGEKISNSVGIPRDVGKFIAKVLEIFNPMSLAASNLLGLAEVLKILVVSINFNRMGGAKE
jgi:hypothetical protein